MVNFFFGRRQNFVDVVSNAMSTHQFWLGDYKAAALFFVLGIVISVVGEAWLERTA